MPCILSILLVLQPVVPDPQYLGTTLLYVSLLAPLAMSGTLIALLVGHEHTVKYPEHDV